jgi:hypothetical protein
VTPDPTRCRLPQWRSRPATCLSTRRIDRLARDASRMSGATESLTFFALLGALAFLIWFLSFFTSSLVGEDRLTRALVGWTAVLAIATIVGAIVAGFTLSAIRGQLSVMEIDKRPWVAIDAAIADTFRAIHAGDQNAAMLLTVDFILSNTGEAPAVYVRIWPMLVITGPPGDPLHNSKLICDHLRTGPITENTATYAIFPERHSPPSGMAFKHRGDPLKRTEPRPVARFLDWSLPAASITASSGDRNTTKPASLLKSHVKRRQILMTGAARSTSWETTCPPPI